jgi:hypothetical protein
MWFGCAYGYLVKYDGTSYSRDSVPVRQGNQFISDFAWDGSKMYVADYINGLWTRDMGSWTLQNDTNSGISNQHLRNVYVDIDKNVWITSYSYGTREAAGIDIYNSNKLVLEIVPIAAEATGLSLYPNPTVGLIRLRSNKLLNGEDAIIYDRTGRVVLTTLISQDQINIGALEAGTYVIRISDMVAKVTVR